MIPNSKNPPILPLTPNTVVLDSTFPVRLRERQVRIKYGYAWKILLRNEKWVIAKAIPLSMSGQIIYLVFKPEIEKEEKIENTDQKIAKHEIIPNPKTWDDSSKFTHKTKAVESFLKKIEAK